MRSQRGKRGAKNVEMKKLADSLVRLRAQLAAVDDAILALRNLSASGWNEPSVPQTKRIANHPACRQRTSA